jgi:uncharacterized protein HemX
MDIRSKGDSPMGKVLALVLVLLVAVGAVGFWRGWFEVQANKQDGKVHANFSVNKEKLKQDKENLKKQVVEKSKVLKDKLASLRGKAKELSGEAKVKAEKEIEALSKKQVALEAKWKDVDEAAADKFESVKQGLSSMLEEKDNDSGKEVGNPK